MKADMFYLQTSVADVTHRTKRLPNDKTKQREEKPLPVLQKKTSPSPQLPRRGTPKMDRFDVVKFDDLTGPGGEEWIKIGGGSFGVVFRVSMICLVI